MKLRIYSKKDFVREMQNRNIHDDTVEDITEYFICIDSSGGTESVAYFKNTHPNVIRESFDDVKEDMIKWGPDIQAYFQGIAITESQAENLVNFIKKIPLDGIVHIHCIKGESRSKAIKDFIDEVILKREIIDDGHVDSGYYRIKELLEMKWTS